MDKKDKIIKKMTKEFIETKIILYKELIPRGYCPFRMYPLEDYSFECNGDCSDHRFLYFKLLRKEIAKDIIEKFELEDLYELGDLYDFN